MKHLQSILAIIVAVLAPIKAVMVCVGFLIIADLITGVWAAIKRKEHIKSAALRRTVTKLLIYQLAVISGFIVEQYMLENFVPVSKVVASVIGLVELKSILENSNSILGYNIFKSIITNLGSDNDKLKEELTEQIKKEVEDQLK